MIARHCRVSLSRRLCTALAALGLLFAATVASVTHSLAMPMMDSGMTVSHQQHGSPVAATSAATAEHDCASSMAADESPVSPLSSSPPCHIMPMHRPGIVPLPAWARPSPTNLRVAEPQHRCAS